MSYYEFILALILVTGYIICVKKKSPPCLANGAVKSKSVKR